MWRMCGDKLHWWNAMTRTIILDNKVYLSVNKTSDLMLTAMPWGSFSNMTIVIQVIRAYTKKFSCDFVFVVSLSSAIVYPEINRIDSSNSVHVRLCFCFLFPHQFDTVMIFFTLCTWSPSQNKVFNGCTKNSICMKSPFTMAKVYLRQNVTNNDFYEQLWLILFNRKNGSNTDGGEEDK